MPFTRKLLVLPLTPTRIALLSSALMVLSGNITFFKHVIELYPVSSGNAGFLLSVVFVLSAVIIFINALLSLFIPARIVASVLLFITAITAYFSDQFGSVTDSVMIRSTMETNLAEVADLITTELLLRLFFLVFLPILLIYKLPFTKASRVTEMRYSGQTMAFSAAIAVVSMLLFSSSYTGFFREHKPVRYFVNPLTPLYSGIKFVSSSMQNIQSSEFILETKFANIKESSGSRKLIVLVLGESARADHFSLNRYHRETNPLLKNEPRLINYSAISSCGTSTAVSVPCMFSLDPRTKFDLDTARNTENVIDVLSKAGVQVLWRDNNSDSKGVASRVAFEDYRSPLVNPDCEVECRDVGMLNGLQEYVDNHKGDLFIVLHQIGSHGPAYYKRYPEAFEKFTPACNTQELGDCTRQEIINAYDNTIVYTDFFLAKVIEFVKHNDQKSATALFYISDHGESLGEKGIYLHGKPYLFAPESQTRVPAMVWAGKSSDIDLEKSKLLKDRVNSHDAIAKTLLELFDVDTDFKHSHTTPLIYFKDNKDDH